MDDEQYAERINKGKAFWAIREPVMQLAHGQVRWHSTIILNTSTAMYEWYPPMPSNEYMSDVVPETYSTLIEALCRIGQHFQPDAETDNGHGYVIVTHKYKSLIVPYFSHPAKMKNVPWDTHAAVKFSYKKLNKKASELSVGNIQ